MKKKKAQVPKKITYESWSASEMVEWEIWPELTAMKSAPSNPASRPNCARPMA